ncbi:MAG: hypothetical protein RLY86_1989 [Pseudomonadota bacterium]|jgi:tetratricopeptide (TPR) repeat protein
MLGLLALAGLLSVQPARAADSPVAAYLSGRIAEGAGDWSLAADQLHAALAADPDNAGLVRRTFLLTLGEGRYDRALALAGRLETLESGSFLADTLLIADALRSGRTGEAASRLPDLPTDGLGQFASPLLAAWVHAADGRTDAALAALAPLDRAQGFQPLKAVQAGLILDLAGRTEEAAAQYQAAVVAGGPLRLIQLVGNFLERQGRGAEARALYLAQAGNDRGDADSLLTDAIDRLDRGEAPAPLVRTAADGLGEAMFDLSMALNQQDAAEMALLYGRVALMLAPDKPLARLMMGDVLAARDRHGAALAEYRSVQGPPAAAWTARLREAESLRQLDRGQEAATLLAAMAAERPDRADALIRLGDMERMAARFDGAIGAYDQALARLSAAGRDDWILRYVRAMALHAADRWPEAEADLRRALDLNPDHPSVLNYLGYTWVDRGERLDEGLALIERAVARRPRDGHIIDSLGWALFKKGDVTAAITHLERAAELEPLDPTINDHLGDVYWAAGRRAEARFQWARAARQATEDPKLRAAVEEKLRNGLPLPKTAGLPAGQE